MPSRVIFEDAVADKGLPHPPPLGYPIPADRHAVSVQLPKWQDMIGMVTKEQRVASVQQIGYPRSFLNQDIVKVNYACIERFGNEDEKCLIFPTIDHALGCESVIAKLAPQAKGAIKIKTIDFILDETSLAGDLLSLDAQTDRLVSPRRFHVVFYPQNVHDSAMIFWRLTGTGISSRLAQSMHQHLDSIKEMPEDNSLLQSCQSSSLERELADAGSDEMIRGRIVSLLRRAAIDETHTDGFTTSDVFLYPTGMAAIYGTQKLLQSWRHQQCVVFGFPYELTLKMMQQYGVDCKFYGFGTDSELDSFADYLHEERKQGRSIQSVWCECASNPLLRTVDLERIRRLAYEYGFVVVIDETIGSFANVDVAGIANIIITSLTKSFSGNANVMAGSVVLNPSLPFYSDLKEGLISDYVNELFAADSRVLEVNSRQFLHVANTMNSNAQHLVSLLSPHVGSPSSSLTHVYYPSTCWSRENYEARMRAPTAEFIPGYGGLFTLEFESVITAATFFDAVNIHKGPSLGAAVSIAQPYVQTVFTREKPWAASYGLRESIVRISVGMENYEALGKEFLRALRLADRFKVGRECRGYLESYL